MVIESYKTKLRQTITEATWLKLQALNLARNFFIVSKKVDIPKEVQHVDFNSLVKEANKEFKATNYDDAKALYIKALAIKKAPFIIAKLTEIYNLKN